MSEWDESFQSSRVRMSNKDRAEISAATDQVMSWRRGRREALTGLSMLSGPAESPQAISGLNQRSVPAPPHCTLSFARVARNSGMQKTAKKPQFLGRISHHLPPLISGYAFP